MAKKTTVAARKPATKPAAAWKPVTKPPVVSSVLVYVTLSDGVCCVCRLCHQRMRKR